MQNKMEIKIWIYNQQVSIQLYYSLKIKPREIKNPMDIDIFWIVLLHIY